MAIILETPIQFIDNAPVKFNNEELSCNKDTRTYCQLVARGDKTTFQVKAPASPNILVNGDFMHPFAKGVANSNVLNKLVDTNALFIGIETGPPLINDNVASVDVGLQVLNRTASTVGSVSVTQSETTILLAADTFPNGNELYIIHGWNDLSGSIWTIDELAGTATCNGGSTILYMDHITRRGTTYYNMTLEVTGMTAGSLIVAAGGTVFATIIENGVYSIYATAGSASTRTVSMQSGGGFDGTVSNMNLYIVDTTLTMQVRDADDTVLAEQNMITVNNGYLTHEIDWDSAPFSGINYQSGLKICVIDNSDGEGNLGSNLLQEVTDENFSFAKSESPNDYRSTFFTRLGNSLLALWPTNGPSFTAQSMYIVNESSRGWVFGRSYTILMFIEQISAGCTVQLNYGGTAGTVYTTAGLKTETVTMNVFQFIHLETTLNAVTKSANISYLKIRSTSTIDGTPAACSECYCLKETHDSAEFCTVLLKYYGDDNQFGFNYETASFIQYMRVRAHLRNPKYKSSGKTFTNSIGKIDITLANSQKWRELAVDELPEYMHDALSVARLHDHVFIDDVEYFFPVEDYEPDWNGDEVSMARVFLECRKKAQDLYNRNC